jgi:hypothetical protein
MVRADARREITSVASYMLCHRHAPEECRVAFAAWKGFSSPLRHHPTVGSCARGGHMLWWRVEAPTSEEALALLPLYLADRTEAVEVTEVPIP